MKKLDQRTRRYLVIFGSTLICVGAAALILTFGTGATEKRQTASSESTSTEAEVSVPEIKVVSQESSSEASAFVPSNGASAAASLTAISKPTSTPPKPTPPASSALTDKTKKPSYSSKPAASKKATTTPKNGEVRNGKTWIDGFGWVEGTGKGGGEVTVVSGFDDGSGKLILTYFREMCTIIVQGRYALHHPKILFAYRRATNKCPARKYCLLTGGNYNVRLENYWQALS